MTWFNKQSKLIKILLLLIPFVNWITELYIRFTNYSDKKGDERLLVFILAIPFGVFLGFVDAIFTLLEDKVILQ